MRAFSRILLLAACVLAASAHAHHLLDWTFVDLGELHPGGQSFGIAVNNRGAVAGYAGAPSGAMHAILWQDGVLHDLGVPPGAAEVFVTDMNADGRILGQTFEGNGVTWKDGTWTFLGLRADVAAINRHDDIAGTSFNGGVERGFVLRDGVLTDLGALEGGIASRVTAMNDAAHVVGRASVSQDVAHAFLWANGGMRDLGTLGRRSSAATAINKHDVVVGVASDDDQSPVTGFLWYGRMFRLLPAFTGVFPTAINEHSDIVGRIESRNIAFLAADGELVSLDALPAVRASRFSGLTPNAINDRRWIVGTGQAPSGGNHAFRLMPNSSSGLQ